jgi:hypothetical protein
MSVQVRSLIALILAGTVSVLMCAPASIGIAKANGAFSVDQAGVYGNSTLFEGTAVETGKVVSELHLQSGTEVILAAGSRGKVYRDRVVLEKGASQLKAVGKYGVDALGLHVTPLGSSSTIQVALNQPNRVQVSALTGSVQVANSQGVLVATLTSGRALDLDPQAAGGAAASHLTGCLQKKNDKYILTDETTNVTVELQGAGLKDEVGNHIEITGATIPGAMPAKGTSQVISVGNLNRLGKGCSSKAGAAAAAAAGAGGAAAAGISATTVAVVAGVGATAAAVGGLAAAGTFSAAKTPASAQ